MSDRIYTSSINPGETILVKGKVEFSHITSFYEGDALKEYNMRRAASNPRYIEQQTPIATITIKDATIINTDEENKNLKAYIEQKMYRSKKYPENGQMLGWANRKHEGITKKGDPYVFGIPSFAKRVDGNKVESFTPEREFAKDLDVVLKFICYKASPNNGVSLDLVLINGPVKYYGMQTDDSLQKYLGLEFSEPNKAAAGSIIKENPAKKEATYEETPAAKIEQVKANDAKEASETVNSENPVSLSWDEIDSVDFGDAF